MFATNVLAIAAFAAKGIAAPSTQPDQATNAASFVARANVDPDNSHGQFIPTTNLLMTNVYQGFIDECLGVCRAGSVCLRFPWGYQTCFDVNDPVISFSFDHLGSARTTCDESDRMLDNHKPCPGKQQCLEETYLGQPLYGKAIGWCVQNIVVQMNRDAFCKGRHQKHGGIWPTEWRDDPTTGISPLGPPDEIPKATFDQDFAEVNGPSRPGCE